MTINGWITEARGQCEAVRLRGVEIAHHRRCICVECEQQRTDLPKALEALEYVHARLNALASEPGAAGRYATKTLDGVKAILTGEVKP